MAMVEGLSVQLNPDINMWDVSPPIIRDWMEANMGPTALLQEGLESAIKLFRYLPLIADEAEKQVKSLTRDGIHLHPDTTKILANQQGPWQRAQTIILGIIATLFAIWLFSDLI
jgi:ubiquinone biosynthesis protein